MKKQIEIITFLVIISIGLAAFFIPAVSADGVVYTEASVSPETINLGESTTVTLRAVTNVTTEKRDVDVVLVTDLSGSMGSGSGSKMEAAQNALETFVGLAGDEMHIGLASFSNADNLYSNETMVKYNNSNNQFNPYEGFYDSSRTNPNQYHDSAYANNGYSDAHIDVSFTQVKTTLNNAIDNYNAKGGTNIAGGINAAKKMLEEQGTPGHLQVIVVMSDGIATMAPIEPGSLDAYMPNDWVSDVSGTARTAAVKASEIVKNEDITVFAIGFGCDADAEETLMAVASTGNYYFAPTTEDIAGIYSKISEEIEDITGAHAYHVLPDNMVYVGNASIEPNIIGGNTLEWIIGDLTPEVPWDVTFEFEVQPQNPGNQPVNVVPDSSVTYTYYGQSGKVTGGGCWIPSPEDPDEKATFGFNAKYKEGETEPSGSLQFNDHATGMHVHSESIATLTLLGTKASFIGTAKVNGTSGYNFTVDVEDNGEPGKDVDKFAISIMGPEDFEYSASGTLKGGNIQIHPESALGAPLSAVVPFPEVSVDVKTPPVADFGWTPTGPHTSEIVTFDASNSSDPDGGSIVSYEWSFEDSGESVTHVFGTEGNYTVTLIVTDDEGKTAEVSKVIEVVSSPENETENQPPVAVAEADNTTVQENKPVKFDGTDSYDPDGYIENYLWEFGDGNTSAFPGPVYAYANDGTYKVNLSVVDNDGKWSEHATLTITVEDPPTDPVNFSIEPGSGADTNSTFIGKQVNIKIFANVTGNDNVTYSVLAGDSKIGTDEAPIGGVSEETFTWIPMSSGKHEITVKPDIDGYPPVNIDVVHVWIEQVKGD